MIRNLSQKNVDFSEKLTYNIIVTTNVVLMVLYFFNLINDICS